MYTLVEPLPAIQGLKTIENSREIHLVRRCQKGDIKAFKELYDQHSEMLFSIAMRLLGSKEDSEDTLQNTFIKVYKNINQFRFDSKFSSYLVRILINTCYDTLEKRKHNPDFSDTFDLIEDSQSDSHLALEEAIKNLPLKMRECFILFAVEGFKQFEISEILDISIGTVKAHISQAKAKLRQILG